MLKTFISFVIVLFGGLILLQPSQVKAAEKASAGDARIVIAKNHKHKNPCRMANPCSAAPLSKKKAMKNKEQVLRYGKQLWQDTNLGSSNMSCATCHARGAKLKNKPYPRYTRMPEAVFTLDQMINFCIINPLKGEALKWDSKKMTALNAYAQKLMHKKGRHKNPCSMKNPCAGY